MRLPGKSCHARRRCFLFATVLHLLLADRIRRKRVVSYEPGWDLDSLNVLVDEISRQRSAGADEDLRTLAKAFNLFVAPCQQVVWMRRVEGRSQKEVAARLGMGEAMVESTSQKLCGGSRTHYLVATQVKSRRAMPQSGSGKTNMFDSKKIEEFAAEWLVRQDGDGWAEADQVELNAWLAASTAHRVAYVRIKAAWQRSRQFKALARGALGENLQSTLTGAGIAE